MSYDSALFPFSLCECSIDLCFCCSSASSPGGTPPPKRFGALGAPDVSTTSEAPEGRGPQVSAVGVASNDETSIIKTVHETDTTTTTGVMAFPMKGKTVASV
jgi:hypothetical protein